MSDALPASPADRHGHTWFRALCVVLADRLLTDGSGLYDGERIDELAPYLDSTTAALEPR